MASKSILNVGFDFSELDRFENVNLKQVLSIDSLVINMMNAIGFNLQADAVEMIQQGPSRSGVEYSRGGKNSRRSADSEPAKTDTGNLKDSVFFQLLGDDVGEVGYLEALAPYGQYLEDENSLNRPVLSPALKNGSSMIEAQKNKLARDIIGLVTK